MNPERQGSSAGEEQGVQIHAGHDRLFVKTKDGTHSALVVRSGPDILISYRGIQYRVSPKKAGARQDFEVEGNGTLTAPMPGLITEVFFAAAEPVKKGDKVIVLEAMKTQQPLLAPFDGVVESISVFKGDQAADGQTLAVIKKNSE